MIIHDNYDWGGPCVNNSVNNLSSFMKMNQIMMMKLAKRVENDDGAPKKNRTFIGATSLYVV